jgi:SAM-dependent methyltransferase
VQPATSLPFHWFGLDPDSIAERTDGIPTTAPPGVQPDALDALELFDDPLSGLDLLPLERVLADAETDPTIAGLVETFHVHESVEEQFEAHFESGTAQAVSDLMGRFGVGLDSTICDLGCGIGWLAYSLDRLGYSQLAAMDTNPRALEHLRPLAGDRIEIIGDLDEWRRIRGRFDALVSVATIHHWDHIPRVALEARRTMKPGAHWFAVMEWFADTGSEFLEAMTSHPTRARYERYEWAYPPSAYVDLVQSVGFTLAAVVPLFYRGNALMTVKPPTPEGIDQAALDALVDERLTGPNGTVEYFWAEVDSRRRDPHGGRLFTRPQVLVFQRTAVEVPPA